MFLSCSTTVAKSRTQLAYFGVVMGRLCNEINELIKFLMTDEALLEKMTEVKSTTQSYIDTYLREQL